MFYLRRVLKSNEIVDQSLGKSYIYTDLDVSPNQFKEVYRHVYKEEFEGSTHDVEKVIKAFVTSEGGKDIIPIYSGSRYYIMTENGKTFNTIY